MEDLKSLFENSHGKENFQRVGIPHPLSLYIGIDDENRYALFCITETMPKQINSTKLIHVYVGKRKDSNFGITFSLLEKKSIDMFAHFCKDIIETSRSVKKSELAADFICGRYIQWQKAFMREGDGKLSFSEVKGLLGELCFLKKKMIPRYGEEKALESWSGIEMTDRDFTCEDTWYEVKSTVSGSSNVRISSVEQLDVNIDGHLAVVTLDKTSNADSIRITLNSMYHIMIETFSSLVLQEEFKSRMLRYGYYEDEKYNQYMFRFNGITEYKVGNTFPCIRQRNIPEAAKNITYDLSLAAIEQFKEG
jgi:hypothetical protein